MELKFTAESHKYETVNDPTKKWISATGILKAFTEPFDTDVIAERCSKKKNGKWFGLTPEEIKTMWNKESKRATDLGSWYHNQREKDLLACDTLQRNGMDLPIIHPIMDGEIKFSPDQKLVSGIYPEHFVYLKSILICGQADRIEVVGDTVNVYDYKTNKKMREAYTDWEGVSKKMLGPLSHIEDSDLMHYALQLSIYMYIILKHNHNLKPGKLQIQHIVFEVESEDKYGFPTTAVDAAGDPIIKEIVPYELPYLKDEVNAMIRYMKIYPKEFGR
jgi:hypothetical protein